MVNRFSILVVLVVVVPLLVAFGIAHKHSGDNSAKGEEMSSERRHKGRTLDEAREATQARVEKLGKLTQDQWNDELKTHPRRHGTLQDAQQRAKDRLTTLEAMTPEEWDAQQNEGNQTKPAARRLPALGPKRDKAGTQQDDDNQ